MRISCSVVCYNNAPTQIAQVLQSVATSSIAVFVYVIDNSHDDRLAAVAKEFGAVYIHLPHNPGFGAAHNVAIRGALENGSTYHLVLNPDIHFSADVIQTLVDYMEQHSDVGLVMPGIRYPDGRQQHLCKLLPNPGDLLMRRFVPALYRRSGRLARYELHASGYDKIMEVPSLSGCFMLLRTRILGETAGFDERFFMYLEDLDLSRRIGQVARVVFFPYVTVVHDYAKGSYKSSRLLFYHIKSAILYFNKWGWFSDVERDAINKSTLKKISHQE
ncbi:glycosyltransferase [Undibacterium arcticum]|uniref:Glycosyltransferase n=1 Tax=Undibacterium arcticum TaxID=1762892 RepID=A0ABV7F7W6_9BURK